MGETLQDVSRISVDVTNIGGISNTSVDLERGITALVGPNATNRTSLVQAIAGALGTEYVSLKGDAREGNVTLQVGDETYTRILHQENGDVATDGDPYLEEPELAELYAVLLESNEIRRAIRHGGDLRDLLMRPVDPDEIDNRIADLVADRREIDAELDRIEILEETRTEMVAKRDRLAGKLANVEDELAEKRATLEEMDDDETEESELAEIRETLREVRTDLEEVERELEIERESLKTLRETRATIKSELASLSVPDRDRIATLESRLEELREQKRTLESVIRELQGVIRFNDDRLEGSDRTFMAALDGTDRPVTAELDPSARTITCWTCGSEVRQDSIGEMVDRLKEIRREQSEKRHRIEAEIADLTDELEALESAREQRSHLQSRLADVREEIETRESTVGRLRDRRDALSSRVADLEADLESRQQSQQDTLLSLQAAVTQLEVERDRTAERLEDAESDLAEVESELERREALESRRAEITAELTDLRTRIDRLESEAVDAFNTHMEAILERLGYDNVDRIWIERTQREVAEGRQEVTETIFELHVVRQSADGAYEDRLEHLSESERELVGLVVALAGYLVHDVHETVPFMMLDSLEMINGERLVDLVDYLAEFVPYLVVVLLPDHATVFDDAPFPLNRIENI
ncbi:MAG: archaea-specific SMC-related protein [Haloarculaceae archaeon]